MDEKEDGLTSVESLRDQSPEEEDYENEENFDNFEDPDQGSDSVSDNITNITVGIDKGTQADATEMSGNESEAEQIEEASKMLADEFGLNDEDVAEQIRSVTNKVKQIKNEYNTMPSEAEILKSAIENEFKRRDEKAAESLSDFMASNILLYIMRNGKVRSIDEMIDERTVLLSLSAFIEEIESIKDMDEKKEFVQKFIEDNFGERIVCDSEEFGINAMLSSFKEEGDFFRGFVSFIDNQYEILYGSRPFATLKKTSGAAIKLDTLYRI